MKILVYSHDWAPSVGGTPKVIISLARGLGSAGASYAPLDLTLVTQTAAGNVNDGEVPFSVVRQPPFRDLLRLIRAADVVHLAGPALVPMSLAWLYRKKLIVQHHNYQAACPNGTLMHNPERSICPNHFLNGSILECVRCQTAGIGWLRSIWKTFLAYPRRWLTQRASANVAVSDYAASRLALAASRTIYNGTQAAAGEIPPAEMNHPARPYVAFIGRLIPDKGIGVLVGAAMQLAEQKCDVGIRIIGDGPERVSLEGLVRFLNLRHTVSFNGWLQGDALMRATSGAIAIVMPSLCGETAGLSAIEQMMQGKLVIASDIGGLGEVLGSAGLKFAPGNAPELAQRIREALEDPEMRVRLGAAARERALALFTERRMITEHLKLFIEVLGVQEAAEGSTHLIGAPGMPIRNTRAG